MRGGGGGGVEEAHDQEAEARAPKLNVPQRTRLPLYAVLTSRV